MKDLFSGSVVNAIWNPKDKCLLQNFYGKAAPKPTTISPSGRPWKPSSYAAPPRGVHHPSEEIPMKHGVREVMPRYRHAPYSRPAK